MFPEYRCERILLGHAQLTQKITYSIQLIQDEGQNSKNKRNISVTLFLPPIFGLCNLLPRQTCNSH